MSAEKRPRPGQADQTPTYKNLQAGNFENLVFGKPEKTNKMGMMFVSITHGEAASLLQALPRQGAPQNCLA